MRIAFASALALVSLNAWSAEPTSDQLRNSWIRVETVNGGKPLVPGEQVRVDVEYSLTPGPDSVLALQGLGPWIDNPDGTYTTKRFHVDYGLRNTVPVKPGTGRHTFTFTVPIRPPGEPMGILWLAAFNLDKGKQWPWHERSGSQVLPGPSSFTVASSQRLGNVFTYGQPLDFALRVGAKATAGEQRTAAWTVIGRDGTTIASGSVPFTVTGPDQAVPLPIATERRGVLGLSVAVEGWGTVETTFARIPDATKNPTGGPVTFGMHHALRPSGDPSALRLGRTLGLTACRQFVSWRNLQPTPDQWHLDGMDKALDAAVAEGVEADIGIVNPPTWIMRGNYSIRYQPFDFDREAWRTSAATLAARWKGKVHSYEWLNEIVPGDDQDPVANYLDFVRIGSETVRGIDPLAKFQLAGGLWPRNYRLSLLTAGIGKYIDVLPVHYSNGAGVEEATGDLRASAGAKVAVWDNETGRGLSVWGMPLKERIAIANQSEWVMERWPDVIQAGGTRLHYFGGGGDAAGNWDYCMNDLTPRPVAATLAVLTSKLAGAVPQGSFTIADSGPFHLFDRGGKAVLVAPAGKPGETVKLEAGGRELVTTDDQGEETRASAGGASLALAARRTFIEGGDLEILRAYTTPELRTRQISLLAGRSGRIEVVLRNRGTKPLAGSLTVALPAGWPAVTPSAFTLAPGEQRLAALQIAAPEHATGGASTATVACRFTDERLPVVEQAVRIHVLVPAELGNLLANGGFDDGQKPWQVSGGGAVVQTKDPLPGVTPAVLRFAGGKSWMRATQALPLAGGRQYLYTAWAHATGMSAGSNIDQTFADGTSSSLYLPKVFIIGNTPEWQLVSVVYDAPKELAKVNFSPTAKGDGEVEYDNLRVTLFDGTVYAAEAVKTAKPPVIDGALDDWTTGCPIPLLTGQVTKLDPAYATSAANLRGIVRMAWDGKNLYLAAEVSDDQQKTATGDEAIDGDSLVLALHPGNRAEGHDAKAFQFTLSNCPPGGGSGLITLYRPVHRAGGLSSGQLARDSSLYELTIKRSGTTTVYELRMPWTELGMQGRFGAKLGCSLQLNDNDGKGRAALISWGDGLHPTWSPTHLGALTLVE